MTDRTNRFSVVFVSGVFIAATIIYCFMTLITLRNCFAIPEGLGLPGAIITSAMLITVLPSVLISVGMILSYLSGRKNEISPEGIMCTKIGVLILSICSFLGGLIISVLVFIGLLAVESYAREMSYGAGRNGESTIVSVLFVLILMISIVCTVLSLVYGIKLFSLLGRVRWYEVRKEEIKTGFLRGITVILAIFNGLSLIISIVLSAVSNQLMYYVYSYLEEIAVLDYIPSLGVSNSWISNLSGACNVAFWILLVILLGKIRDVYRMSGRQAANSIGDAYQNSFVDMNEVETFIVDGDSQTDRLVRNTSGCGKITSMSGRDAGRCYEIKDGEELVIGLTPSAAHIVVDSAFNAVSRKHCAIRYIADTDEYFVIDYSTNGTFLNGGMKLNKNSYVAVQSGTVIKLGNDEVAYRLGS